MSLTEFQKASFRQHTHLASQVKDENGDPIETGGSSGPTLARIGKDAIGASHEATGASRIYCKKVTIAGKTLIASAAMHVKPNAGGNVAQFAVALAKDNAGVPGRLVALTAIVADYAGETSAPQARWTSVPLNAVVGGDSPIGGDGDYWIMFCASPSAGTWDVYYDATGTDQYCSTGGSWFLDGQQIVGSTGFTTPNKAYSLYADVMVWTA